MFFARKPSTTSPVNRVMALVSPERPANKACKPLELEEPQQRHTFNVSQEEVARGDHTAAVVWLLREIPQARRLEIRYFTGDDREMSLEFTWVTGSEDSVSRSVDIEVSEHQVVPLGTTLLCMVAEAAKNLKELKLYSGLERLEELQLSTLLTAFSVAGHWNGALEKLEINWSCIEEGTFSRLQTYPSNLRTIVLDGCMVIDENEVNIFLSELPKLESFQVIGNSEGNEPSSSMMHI